MGENDKTPNEAATANSGNGGAPKESIGDPEFFLAPLLASDPLPYLFDGEGHAVTADGARLDENDGNGVPPAIKRLQKDARPRRPARSF